MSKSIFVVRSDGGPLVVAHGNNYDGFFREIGEPVEFVPIERHDGAEAPVESEGRRADRYVLVLERDDKEWQLAFYDPVMGWWSANDTIVHPLIWQELPPVPEI